MFTITNDFETFTDTTEDQEMDPDPVEGLEMDLEIIRYLLQDRLTKKTNITSRLF
jgi:hypothetical protein